MNSSQVRVDGNCRAVCEHRRDNSPAHTPTQGRTDSAVKKLDLGTLATSTRAGTLQRGLLDCIHTRRWGGTLQHDTGVTQQLRQWQQGDEGALDALLPLVYEDLRRIAAHELRSHRGHETLQPTALINDVFVRLLGASSLDISNRKHLYTTAAKLMRQILIDRARAQSRDKRGGGQWQRVDFIEAMALPIEQDTHLPALDEALTALAALDARMAEIVELRYFVGLEVVEVANLLGVDERTVYRDWAMARAWLRHQLGA
ncbi:MAG: sigma-70 family RNA polymerase sigma factor [Rhodanobacteraceae bacterium]|nr:sigma-70 family RNA polymerase sigma factor [Rhodanobacteraceae bacterium]